MYARSKNCDLFVIFKPIVIALFLLLLLLLLLLIFLNKVKAKGATIRKYSEISYLCTREHCSWYRMSILSAITRQELLLYFTFRV